MNKEERIVAEVTLHSLSDFFKETADKQSDIIKDLLKSLAADGAGIPVATSYILDATSDSMAAIPDMTDSDDPAQMLKAMCATLGCFTALSIIKEELEKNLKVEGV